MMVSESRFNMWRALFAMAHVDHVVSKEEKAFLYRILQEEFFTGEQRALLENDIHKAQDIAALFGKITDQEDRSEFFYYARALVWCDGNFDEQEQKIMTALRKSHFNTADFEALTSDLDLSVDDDEKESIRRQRTFIEHGYEPQGFFNRLLAMFGK